MAEYDAEIVKCIADMTVELVKIRAIGCKHLCVENTGPEIFGRLMEVVYPAHSLTVADTLSDYKIGSHP